MAVDPGILGAALRSASTELGVQLALVASSDSHDGLEGGAEIRLSDGTVAGAFVVGGGSTVPAQPALLNELAQSLAQDIDNARFLAAENLSVRVREILDGALVRVVLQPVVDLTTGATTGFEALARVPSDPRHGAAFWFAAAEAAGLARELEIASVEAALAALRVVPSPQWLSLNVSPDTLLSEHFGALINSAALERLVIELTEHAPIADYARVRLAVDELRDKGARLAIDDVGAGFASMNHVVALEPDLIKLDLSLIRNIDRDPTKQALVRSLTAFASDVGAAVVAEGLEAARELAAVKAIGVRYAQGFLLGRPAPCLADGLPARPETRPSAIGEAIEERLLDNIAKQLGLSVTEARALSPESRTSLWRKFAFDGLTGALQRSAGLASLEREIARARRHGEPLTVIFTDLDGLKAVNDRHGHQAGDRVLRRFAEAVTEQLRREDFMFRYGGDEFVCVLPRTTRRGADLVTSRIQHSARSARISFSAGTAELRPDDSIAELLHRADDAMYRAKKPKTNS